VDVNVQGGTTAIANRYGTNTGARQILKMDHCEYLYVGTPVGGCHWVDPTDGDVSYCMDRCLSLPDSCFGVQMTKVTNPVGTLPITPNIPFIPFVKRVGVNFGLDKEPCGQLSVDGRKRAGCTGTHPRCLREDYYASDTVCFGVRPLRDTRNQVEEDFRIATSPEDPAWYSTCWVIRPEGQQCARAQSQYQTDLTKCAICVTFAYFC
jgi:hypothetical protein